jgi:alpha-L-fucosidase
MNDQLTELLTNYGPIAGIWFDGWWDNKEADWKLEEQYALIHKLQPGCLVGNNHHQAPKQGEDFQMFEKDLPGHNTTGFSGESSIGQLPLEMCETMNGSWGYNLKDRKFKSSKSLIHLLVKSAGYGSNFLLNVGPTPVGTIQKEFQDTLKKIGEWTGKYGETIYGTRKGPIEPRNWGVTTEKGNKVFVHVLEHNDQKIWLPLGSVKVKSATSYGTKAALPFQQMKDGILLQLPEKREGESHRIIELTR